MQTDDSDNGLSLVIRVVLPVMGEERVNTFTKGNLCPASRQQVGGQRAFSAVWLLNCPQLKTIPML